MSRQYCYFRTKLTGAIPLYPFGVILIISLCHPVKEEVARLICKVASVSVINAPVCVEMAGNHPETRERLEPF